jgi:hypothetical protein
MAQWKLTAEVGEGWISRVYRGAVSMLVITPILWTDFDDIAEPSRTSNLPKRPLQAV